MRQAGEISYEHASKPAQGFAWKISFGVARKPSAQQVRADVSSVFQSFFIVARFGGGALALVAAVGARNGCGLGSPPSGMRCRTRARNGGFHRRNPFEPAGRREFCGSGKGHGIGSGDGQEISFGKSDRGVCNKARRAFAGGRDGAPRCDSFRIALGDF